VDYKKHDILDIEENARLEYGDFYIDDNLYNIFRVYEDKFNSTWAEITDLWEEYKRRAEEIYIAAHSDEIRINISKGHFWPRYSHTSWDTMVVSIEDLSSTIEFKIEKGGTFWLASNLGDRGIEYYNHGNTSELGDYCNALDKVYLEEKVK
jgi:hypothetical protein